MTMAGRKLVRPTTDTSRAARQAPHPAVLRVRELPRRLRIPRLGAIRFHPFDTFCVLLLSLPRLPDLWQIQTRPIHSPHRMALWPCTRTTSLNTTSSGESCASCVMAAREFTSTAILRALLVTGRTSGSTKRRRFNRTDRRSSSTRMVPANPCCQCLGQAAMNG